MKIMVTGGSGFIGSNLVEALIAEGHEVIIYDISFPKHNSKAKHIAEDVLNKEALIEATKDIDVVYHLAAQANVDFMFKSPVYSTANNIIGTMNVLEAVRVNGCKRIIFASTDWVYGASSEEEVNEETKLYPKNSGHIYTSSKIAAEMLIRDYHDLYGVDYTIMRYGIPFGPRGKHTTVTPIFIKKAIKGEPITIKGAGDQFRQFIYIKDLIKGNVLCLKEEAKNQVINLNGSEKITIRNVADSLNEIFGGNLQIVHEEARPGDFKGKKVSSEKAKTILGWEPAYKYKEALKDYVQWFKKNEIGEEK